MTERQRCSQCGARLVADAEVCDLCGTPVPGHDSVSPDWIDASAPAGPAYRTLPDPPGGAGRPYPVDSLLTAAARRKAREAREARAARRPAKKAPAHSTAPSAADSGAAADADPRPDRAEFLAEENFFAPSEGAPSDSAPLEGALPEKALPENELSVTTPSVPAVEANTAAAEYGPTDMERTRSADSFESADVLPEEDFFAADGVDGGDADGSASEADEADEADESGEADGSSGTDRSNAAPAAPLGAADAPTDMQRLRQSGSFEAARVLEAEDFFAGTAADAAEPADADTTTNVTGVGEPNAKARAAPVPDADARELDELERRRAAARKATADRRGGRPEKTERKRRSTEPPGAPALTSSDQNAAFESAPVVPPEDFFALDPRASALCRSCGRTNAPADHFCATCGRKVNRPDQGRLRNVLVVAAAGTLIVSALFLIRFLGSDARLGDGLSQPVAQSAVANPIAPPSLSPGVAQLALNMIEEIGALDGLRRVARQRELVALYVRERRFDLAGGVQEEIARTLGTEIEWIRTGNHYYDWMESQSGAAKTEYARRAIRTYQRALDLNPDNLDVRTDMALAYLYDPENPREALRHTRLVLDRDPDHLQANFNMGVMMLFLNRFGDARSRFERVRDLVGDSRSPMFQRAEAALENVRRQRSGRG